MGFHRVRLYDRDRLELDVVILDASASRACASAVRMWRGSVAAQRRSVAVTRSVIDLPNRSRVTVDLDPPKED